MKVVEWIGSDSDKKVSAGGLGGFFQNGMRWRDYIGDYDNAYHKSYYEALRVNIVENNIRINGSEHQNNKDGTPLFDDGTIGVFSFRAWGDLMAAIWSEAEDKDYHYMDFYC